MKILTAIPVYNEERNVASVLQETWRYSSDILVVNDGSRDRTAEILDRLASDALDRMDFFSETPSGSRAINTPTHHAPRTTHHAPLAVVAHAQNRGYGAALISAFAYALEHDFDVLVTMDCDGQHEPARIPVLVEAIHDADIVSGSRYLRDFRQNSAPPLDRMHVNRQITQELNERFGLNLTDSFCGFKAYRREALSRLCITESGWGMPLQLWVQAAYRGLRIKEVGVPRIYIDLNRAFGGALNDPEERLAHYRRVIADAVREEEQQAYFAALVEGSCR